MYFNVGPAFFSGASAGFACPSYATVLLQLTNVAYTPPVVDSGNVILKLLPCPYTPPTVI